MALIYYKCGMLPQAIDTQKKVSALLKNNAEVQKNSAAALDYYARALKLQQQIKPQPTVKPVAKPQPAAKPTVKPPPAAAPAVAKPQQVTKPQPPAPANTQQTVAMPSAK
jgi:hypothetical protein